MMKSMLIVVVGSGFGGAIRYLLQIWAYRLYPSIFPVGTLAVNIAGCLLIGIFFAMAEKSNTLSAEARLFLITGICGGFTTFSSFSVENILLLKTGHLVLFMTYLIASVVLGLLATLAGMQLVKTF